MKQPRFKEMWQLTEALFYTKDTEPEIDNQDLLLYADGGQFQVINGITGELLYRSCHSLEQELADALNITLGVV